MLLRLIQRLSRFSGKRLELCCPGGVPNAVVDRFRRDGLHFGRLR